MKKLAFVLSIVTAMICMAKFAYDLVQFGQKDYFILSAGLFILAIGFINRTNQTQP